MVRVGNPGGAARARARATLTSWESPSAPAEQSLILGKLVQLPQDSLRQARAFASAFGRSSADDTGPSRYSAAAGS